MEITFLPTNTSEIHLHVEQLLQNTYWTLAEDLRLPKRQETPHIPGWGKRKKKKQRQKNRDETCTSWREMWRRKGFHTLGSPFTDGGGVGGGGSFRATEESTETGVWRAQQRDSRTDDRCRPALTSPRGLSAHPLGQVGAGNWGSSFGYQNPGRGLGLAAWTQPEGG